MLGLSIAPKLKSYTARLKRVLKAFQDKQHATSGLKSHTVDTEAEKSRIFLLKVVTFLAKSLVLFYFFPPPILILSTGATFLPL